MRRAVSCWQRGEQTPVAQDGAELVHLDVCYTGAGFKDVSTIRRLDPRRPHPRNHSPTVPSNPELPRKRNPRRRTMAFALGRSCTELYPAALPRQPRNIKIDANASSLCCQTRCGLPASVVLHWHGVITDSSLALPARRLLARATAAALRQPAQQPRPLRPAQPNRLEFTSRFLMSGPSKRRWRMWSGHGLRFDKIGQRVL